MLNRAFSWARPLTLCVAVMALAATGHSESRDEWQQPRRVIADLGLRRDAQVADIGCGSGYFTLPIAAVVTDGKVLAVDPSIKALNSLRDGMRRRGAKNIEVIESRGSSTGLPDGACDAVLICDVLHEVSPPSLRPALVKDIARAMKPGASLYLLDYRKIKEATRFDPIEKIIAREDLIRLATDAGLVMDAEFHYLKYQVFLRFRKPDEASRAARQ